MGLYSNNRTSLSKYEISASGNYVGESGMATLMYEATQEDMKFFDLIIANDFREATLVVGDNGYVTESTQEIITEGAAETLKKAWDKFVAFIKSIIAKIKSIFKSLFVKIESVFCKDSKAFAEKYKDVILDKNLKDMKYKWGDSSKFGDILSGDSTKVEFTKDIKTEMSKTADFSSVHGKSYDDYSKRAEEITDDLYKTLSKYDDKDEMRTKMFEDEIGTIEELDTGADKKRNDVYHLLVNGTKLLAKLKDDEAKITKAYEDLLKTVESEQKEIKTKSLSEDKNIAEGAKKRLVVLNTRKSVATTAQTVALDEVSIKLEIAKKQLSLCKAFWAKAAAYREVVHNSALFDAIDEAVEYEVDSSFGI